MQKKYLYLVVLTGVIGIASANAARTATITALKSPVWIQQDNRKTEIRGNSKLKIGDNIATGDTGRIELQLWVNARLQLNSNSEISIRAKNAAAGRPELYLQQGRACINYSALSSREQKLVINIGNMMFASIHLDGDICLFRGDGLSAVKLRAGSVQVTHAVDPNMIILSESGAEFHIEDDGSYQLLFPGDDLSTFEVEKPFVVEEVAPAATPATVADSNTDTGELTRAEFEATGEDSDPVSTLVSTDKKDAASGEFKAKLAAARQDQASDYIYTVYLFSTREEEAALRVNRKFQQAGHDTRIFESTIGSVLYYRVAAPGFESRQAARGFSDAIVGTLGVTQTWIGREKSIAAEKVTAQDAANETVEPVDSDNVAIRETTAAQTGTALQDDVSDYVYTVYLFSTRDEEVAAEVNQRIQQAGHDTRVVESTTGSVLRYRVVAPGFESSQAAKNFSDAIVGTLGVTQTWIGKDRR